MEKKTCGTIYEFTIKFNFNSSIYKGIWEVGKSGLQQIASTPKDAAFSFLKEIISNPLNPLKLTNSENEVYSLNLKADEQTNQIIFYLKSAVFLLFLP